MAHINMYKQEGAPLDEASQRQCIDASFGSLCTGVSSLPLWEHQAGHSTAKPLCRTQHPAFWETFGTGRPQLQRAGRVLFEKQQLGSCPESS